MRPLIVVSSKTGNTRVIARALQDGIGPCDYVEAAQMPSDLRAYNPIVLCFWCDRGMAPEDTKAAAERIKGKDIACFATMGGDRKTESQRLDASYECGVGRIGRSQRAKTGISVPRPH